MLQQATHPTVQLELENSIKSLDQARFFANLDFLKQSEEAFHKKSDVQEQLDDFKKEVNSKLNQILCQTVQTAKKFTFQPEFQFTFTPNGFKTTTSHSKTASKTAQKTVLQHQQPKSYAAALEKSLEASTWTTVHNSKSKFTATPRNTSSYRDRRLIITPTTVVKTLDSISIRNNINNALKSANLNIRVATVTMSQSKSNIVITTLSDTTAEDLLKHQKT